MNGGQAKKLRRLSRRAVEEKLSNVNIVAVPKPWFRAYCRWAKIRHTLGFPVSPELMKEKAIRGVRREIVPLPTTPPKG